MRLIGFLLLSSVVLAACNSDAAYEEMPKDVALSPAEIAELNAFATGVLNGLQDVSFDEEREFCGYILRDETGAFSATPVRRGRLDSCDPGALSADVVASFHTHGAYNDSYNNEIPSTIDLETDFEAGIDGYVSTPSGRIWRISHDDRRAYKLCGPGCVLADPEDDPGAAGQIPRVLSLEDIAELE